MLTAWRGPPRLVQWAAPMTLSTGAIGVPGSFMFPYVGRGHPPASVPDGPCAGKALHAGRQSLQRHAADAVRTDPPARTGTGRADRRAWPTLSWADARWRAGR